MRKTKRIIRRLFTVIIILLFVFALSFVGFGYLVNKYSPEVDVQIGDNTSYNPNEQVANIDERLKDIQDEDNGLDEKPVESEKVEPSKPQKDDEDETVMKNTEKKEVKKEDKKEKETAAPKPSSVLSEKPPIPKKSEIANQAATSSSVSSGSSRTRVFAGYYNSLEDAVVAQKELNDLFPGVSPFIKEQSGYYIVQLGIYSNPDTAEEMYNKLKRLRYPAKIKSE